MRKIKLSGVVRVSDCAVVRQRRRKISNCVKVKRNNRGGLRRNDGACVCNRNAGILDQFAGCLIKTRDCVIGRRRGSYHIA